MIEEAARSTVSAAGEQAGEEVGESIGQQVAASANLPTAGTAQWNQFMVTQAQVIFNYAFAANGMWPAEANYEAGEWVQYQFETADGEDTGFQTVRRALLTTTDAGNEWWRVEARQEGESWVYEALLNPENGEVVRLRSKDPEGNVGEVPVTERTVYQSPQRLTEESIEGATVGERQLDTPAGSFTTQEVRYKGGGMQGGTVVWFLSEQVPGHVVQYRVEGSQGNTWTSTLADYGSNATTTLNSY